MNPELSSFATRLRALIQPENSSARNQFWPDQFERLALELFALQFQNNPVYQKVCQARNLTPGNVANWTRIPAMPTGSFKELEVTSIPPESRTMVFHSSGTTEQKPSRHFHCQESLAVYEASLWEWFSVNVMVSTLVNASSSRPSSSVGERVAESWLRGNAAGLDYIFLTPPPEQVPNSSLVHMFNTVWQKADGAGVRASRAPFFGKAEPDGAWTLDFEATLIALNAQNPKLILGTAFSFVHLLDFMAVRNIILALPAGTRVMETGGYKNRSRSLPKAELHALITRHLGVPRENIFCEYGMSELSSQAYGFPDCFQFPPWARVQIISPETGREVAEGETGLIRIFDLANVFSVAVIQTEDLGIRRGNEFELAGRAQLAEPRGCSLMSV